MKYISHEKLLHHADRLAEIKLHGETAPINVQLCPYDGQCNHACPMCVAGYEGFTGEVMDVATFERVVAELKDVGVRSITLTGGSEPLMHPEFDTLVEILAASGIDSALITNGSVMSKERAALLVEHFAWVRISLDAQNAIRFRKMHGSDGFEEVLANIRLLVHEKRRRAGHECATLGVAFLTSATESCTNSIDLCAMLGRSLGVDYAQFRPILKTPRGKERIWANTEHQKRLMAALQKAKLWATPSYAIEMNTAKYERIEHLNVAPYTKCGLVQIAPGISASGNVALCCHHFERPEFIVGNIHEQSFREIWYSDRKREAIKNLPLSECPLLCRGCGINETMEAGIPEAAISLAPNRHGNFI